MNRQSSKGEGQSQRLKSMWVGNNHSQKTQIKSRVKRKLEPGVGVLVVGQMIRFDRA